MSTIYTEMSLPHGQDANQALAQQRLNTAKSLAQSPAATDKQIEKAVNGFEALLLHQMLKAMWETVETTGILGEDGNEAKMYRDMLNQAIADSIAEGKGIGIKDIVRKELVRGVDASEE